MDEIFKDCKDKMDKAIEALKKDMGRIRTGRANPAVLDGLRVDYYGSPTPLKQLAAVSTPDPRTLMVAPYDKGCIKAIEQAINASDLALPPHSDGHVIRLNVPEPTQERRKELVKDARKKGEEAKVAIRNVRRDGNEAIKKAEKDRKFTEDQAKKEQERIQKLTDEYCVKVDDVLKHKEQDILNV